MTQGLFDRSMLGVTLPDVSLTVDTRSVSFFCETLGMVPAEDGIAPASFFTYIDALADTVRQHRGEPTILEHICCDLRYLLHGEESYDLLDVIRAGDRLVIKSRIADFYDSSRGHLEFAVVEQTAVEELRGLLVTARRTYIHRLSL